ncbi:MAG: response regulator transcription factor [Clostridia bacterium]|nr:response regulator transcription factor [Clostridia bacterium]
MSVCHESTRTYNPFGIFCNFVCAASQRHICKNSIQHKDDRTKPRKVLIVDDDAVLRMVLKKYFTTMGHSVVGEAGNGYEAIDLVERYKPDFVTMDIRMPQMNGLDATRRIKELYPDTTITIVSSELDSDTVMEAFISGAKFAVDKTNISGIDTIKDLMNSI